MKVARVIACACFLTAPLAYAACSDTSSCSVTDCAWTDSTLLACAAVDSGIYGLGSSSCGGGGSQCDNNPGSACYPGITVTATSNGQAATTVTGSDGRYALELAPGTYSVCCTGYAYTTSTCAPVAITAGAKVHVDMSFTFSPGGLYCVASVK